MPRTLRKASSAPSSFAAGVRAEIEGQLRGSLEAKRALLQTGVDRLTEIALRLNGVLVHGGTVYALGNGGSAADAQHLAAELVGRYRVNRAPLRSVALTVNTSTLTAIANDFGFEEVFVRQVAAHVGPGDALVAFSTSGRSRSVVRAAEEARRRGAVVIGFTGRGGGDLGRLCDLCFEAPSSETPRIQECHVAGLHAVCGALENLAVAGATAAPAGGRRGAGRRAPS